MPETRNRIATKQRLALLSDEELINRVQQENGQAFERLVSRYKKRLYHCVLRLVNDTACAEDLVQETFLRVYQRRHSYQPKASFSTWIYTIALNLARSELRKQRRRQFFSLDWAGRNRPGGRVDLCDREDLPYDRACHQELAESIHQAIDELPPKYRSVVVLRDVQGLSYEKISEILQCPVGTVKSRVNRARLKLQNKLRQWQF